MTIKLHNSLTGKLEDFVPIDAEKGIRMYVCGPTVYDRPHLGNARAVVVYDVLYRLLKTKFDKVTYARNITDVDDKINAAAKERGTSINELTKEVTDLFHSDMEALNNLSPDFEPKATENMAEIINMIERIVKNGKGYVSEGHVLFDVNAFGELEDEEEPFCCSDPHHHHAPDYENEYFYGKLSGKKLEDNIAGARIEVESYKRNPEDFVLWKPASESDDESSKFDNPPCLGEGVGRPGWHIECSAMSTKILGENFDIHGGGADLKFPHHENEIAQSLSANPFSSYAKYWVHNGFLTVNGEKMSKSLGNFTTVTELLDKGISGEVIRLALLSSHYRKPLDFNDKLIEDSKKTLDKFYKVLSNGNNEESPELFDKFMNSICDDMNYPLAISCLHEAKGFSKTLKDMCNILGICQTPVEDWFNTQSNSNNSVEVKALIRAHKQARADKNWAEADNIRNKLTELGAYPYE